ncbi:MAG: sigma-70 family RNA polymerase sigma factor [Myxococcaceae bacterium]|nr:sigma-70 family RNA polymerase sigma factor [Myxococcaceae bacterium]
MMSRAEVKELSDRVARGDARALERLFNEFAGLARAVALKVLKDEAEADELVQEAFVEVWRRSTHFQPERAAFSTWLSTIVRTRAIDRLRSRGRADRSSEVAARGEAELTETVSALLRAERDARRVRKHLANLDTDHRQVLELAYYEGLSHQDIAERTGLPLGTVKGRVRAAMKRLHEAVSAVESFAVKSKD